ncbi:hypothetical protein [Haloarcula marismortui]|uniref:Beta-lactamase domain-containing protein n=1 Tax=Haloarcula marismortui ATCC 33800 TaxID=662476 RepID=M0JQV2_9EURY|nr:hypothetical protein [Haloarcula sinaiiensis]EMA10015.1 beta-lactamase domain-containing protein [Haloarcula sinaiiensis ATCC 33800]QUJ74958.1 hypothetical protein KDQ40_22830 [Haloarcula sinaiiensis ATCC 33800]
MGEWLVSGIEQSDPVGVAIWYLGCNGFVLQSATQNCTSTCTVTTAPHRTSFG